MSEETETCPKPEEKIIPAKPLNMSKGAVRLRRLLNKSIRIKMFDSRVLIGVFLCTDRDANIILGSCTEYLTLDSPGIQEEPRMLGLVMVPGKHIQNVSIDENQFQIEDNDSISLVKPTNEE